MLKKTSVNGVRSLPFYVNKVLLYSVGWKNRSTYGYLNSRKEKEINAGW